MNLHLYEASDRDDIRGSPDDSLEYKDPKRHIKLSLDNKSNKTHLSKVDSLKGKFSQTFTPVHVRLRSPSDTTSTELGADTVLEQR
jgi:hypothetical protein